MSRQLGIHIEPKKLCNCVTPNAIMKDDNLSEDPIPLVDIIGGTWLFCIEKFGEDGLDSVNKMELSNRLGLKAIELSHIQTLYKEHQQNDIN